MSGESTGHRRLVFDRAPWRARAACRGEDPGWFFPGPGADQSEQLALCAGCPVRAECLAYALANRERDGIWGGTSARQRRRILRARAAGGVAA